MSRPHQSRFPLIFVKLWLVILLWFCTDHHGGKEVGAMLSFERRACRAKNLMRASRYICLEDGSFVCETGWDHNPVIGPDEFDPCPIPVCSKGCVNGVCTGPNQCNCHVGWRGMDCTTCINLPGCQHGSCHNRSMACYCDKGYTGGKCDRPICTNCTNGHCVHPEMCICHAGWAGDACDQCLPSVACVHGKCKDNQPNTCLCDEGWTGDNCDKPKCTPACHPERGVCTISEGRHICLCQFGYQGVTCSYCKPYWACPNRDPRTACTKPNECICPPGQIFRDPFGICNNQNLPPPRIQG